MVLVTLDMPQKSANVLTEQMFADLDQAWDEIDKVAADIRGVVIQSAKEKIFVAGADLVRIANTLDWSDQEIVKFCEDGRKIFARFKSNPFPVVAAIRGACVGGGFELALWCDLRVASNDRRTVLGLPETKLGLVPGWAGTCMLPRLIGVSAAARMTALAKLIDSTTALELGAVSQVVEAENLVSAAVDLIESEIQSQNFVAARKKMLAARETTDDLQQIKNDLIPQIHATDDVDNVAAQIVLEHMIDTANDDFQTACRGESTAMTHVYGSDNCAGLLNSFFLNERARKSGAAIVAESKPPEIKTIGIVGCGQMGAGLVELSLKAGYSVIAFDRTPEVLEKLKEIVAPQADDSKLSIAGDLAAFSDCDLIIESILEDTDEKRELFQQMSEIVRDDAIISTNTSVIPLADLESSAGGPQRFVGFHFCSPIAQSRLVEVIRGSQTHNDSVAAIINVTRNFRKTPIVMNDGPGFIVNRLLSPYFEEAHRVIQGGNTLEEIDDAMREYGFPLGPFEMMDLIGNDVVYHAGKMRYVRNPESVFLSPLIPKVIKAEYLGHKNGIGYYDYSNFDLNSLPQQKAPANAAMVDLIDEYTTSTDKLDSETIQLRLTYAMLQEACAILDEGIVDDVRDIDLCLQLGLGYPANKGGLLFWSDWKEIGAAVEQMKQFDKIEQDSRFAPHQRLLDMVQANTKFYSSRS